MWKIFFSFFFFLRCKKIRKARSLSLSLSARASARELQQVDAFAGHVSCSCVESVHTGAVAAVTATAAGAVARTHTYSLLSSALCVNTTHLHLNLSRLYTLTLKSVILPEGCFLETCWVTRQRGRLCLPPSGWAWQHRHRWRPGESALFLSLIASGCAAEYSAYIIFILFFSIIATALSNGCQLSQRFHSPFFFGGVRMGLHPTNSFYKVPYSICSTAFSQTVLTQKTLSANLRFHLLKVPVPPVRSEWADWPLGSPKLASSI